MHESEKLGGLLVTQEETIDTISCINAYYLNELKFTRTVTLDIEEECIFKRLERVFGNNEFMNTLQRNEVHHGKGLTMRLYM